MVELGDQGGGRRPMGKYLYKAQLSEHGIKGTMDEGGTARAEAIKKATEGAGGTVESFYYAFGGVDAYVIVDMPSDSHAVAMAAAVEVSGAATVETVVLVEPETVDAAAQMTADYRPPGETGHI